MILMIYREDTCREYILPKSNNIDYSILLYKKQFHIKDNIQLRFESIENEWILHGTDYYTMQSEGKSRTSVSLKMGDIIFFKTYLGEKFQGIVAEESAEFLVFDKYDISMMEYVSIGKDRNNMIAYQFRDLISKNHGALRKEAGLWYVEDFSANGIFINYERVKERVRLKFGDIINIFGLRIIFLDRFLGICSSYGNISIDKTYLKNYVIKTTSDIVHHGEQGLREKTVFFNRSPRNIPYINTGTIEIEAPPAPKITHKRPVIFTIGPSFTMALPMMLGCFMSMYASRSHRAGSGAFMYTGIITALGSAALGVIWALANLKYSKQQEREDEQLRFDSYGNYLIEKSEEIKKQYKENTEALYSMYPSAEECTNYDAANVNLWNRNSTHKDFCFFRLGLGDMPFQVNISTPKEKFTLLQDNLKKQPDVLLEEYEYLRNVPVGIDIREKKLWGVVGGKNYEGAMNIVYNLVSQICASVCYTDIKLAFIYDDTKCKNPDMWEFAKWLPHVWSEDKKNRYVASNELDAKDVFFEIANVMRHRTEEAKNNEKGKIQKPYYVLFIAAPELIEGELIKKYIFEPNDQCGMTTFIIAGSYDRLPNHCENIIQYDSSFSGAYNTMDIAGDRRRITFDSIQVQKLETMAKRLSNIWVNEAETNADIPNSLEFLEMYGVRSLTELKVLDRWRKNRTFNTMKALIGKKAGGSDCYLDIHEKYHGPHGLIAGTTGSGKSETLQTYMLSLAINYSPDDIGFFVIDFKGGGMANLFSNLPHMVGQISNLSGNQVRRAMISIKSENMRRQRLFSEHGVNNINLYTRLYKNNETKIPIPHLFIIIDEFAELKREEPDFMRELISVAQVGRSLGVHLILATQKPSGTVDDNIWSNSKFRLCLRVQDKQDSNDMLHKPDAAFITQAGRCYLQVGNDEIYELFQSGWSGAVYDESETEALSEIATMITLTGKTAIVGSHAKIKRKENERKKYYTAIVGIAMALMFTEHIYSADDLDELKLNSWGENVIEQMNSEGMEYEKNNANMRRMKDMLKLWPFGSMSAEQIAVKIMEDAGSRNIKLPQLKEKTQLDAIVEYLRKLADEHGYNHNLQLWLPVLPTELYFEDIVENRDDYFDNHQWNVEKDSIDIEIPVGLYDDPENQAQAPVFINFSENGHMAVCGAIVSGKSTFLQTLMYGLVMKYTPEYINIYGIDFSSGMLKVFENMPQVGGIIGENDVDSIAKLFNMLDKLIEDRKKIFGGGNYAQYVRAYGRKYPAIFLIIDNFANFAEKTDNVYADNILRLTREGVAYGIFVVMSSAGFGITEIPNRVADNIKNIICLEMGDKFKYMDVLHTTGLNVLPESEVKGRGLVNVQGTILEFQTALAYQADDDYKRGQMIEKLGDVMKSMWSGRCARPIPSIPEKPVLSEFNRLDDVIEMNESSGEIPIAYREIDASIFSIVLAETYCYVVTGKSKTGKTMLLKTIFEQASYKHARITVIEKKAKEFEKIVGTNGAQYLNTDIEVFEFFKALIPEFVRRNKLKHSYESMGLTGGELYEKMKNEQPIFIFIADMSSFIKTVYKPDEGAGNMSGFMENILEKGELHNIYFFSALNTEDYAEINMYKAYKLFVGYKTGVHLGGNTAAQRIFEFQNIPFSQASRIMRKGMGYAATGEDGNEAEKIVFPLYGK